jgi:hypothetical protein
MGVVSGVEHKMKTATGDCGCNIEKREQEDTNDYRWYAHS